MAAPSKDESEPSADMFREALRSEYDKDFELKQRLDTKASNMVTMAGAVAALFTGFSTFVLKDASSPNIVLLVLSIVALLIELAFLIKTIHASIAAMRMADYTHVAYWSKFFENGKLNNSEISKWKAVTKREMNRQMIEDYLEASRKNYELNDKKAKYLDEAQRVFMYAVIMIPIAAVLSIATRIIT